MVGRPSARAWALHFGCVYGGVASAASFLESLGCGFGFRETGDELWCLLERVRLLVKVWRVLGRTGEGRERSGETR
jgi:hypothetical protein